MLRCLRNAKIQQTFFDAINAISSLVVKHRVFLQTERSLFSQLDRLTDKMPYALVVSPCWPFAMDLRALKVGGCLLHLAVCLANAVELLLLVL